jgi:hypothetical protein
MSLMNKAQEELERRILHGLSYEWKTALGILDPSFKKAMLKPLFSLRDMKNRWGYWSAEKHEICLNRELVLNHSWDSVREVLHHEMAHQLAEEVLSARNESPHGPKFLKACSLLRANPNASGNYTLLDERIFHRSATRARDKMMLRIKKLMALAESQNQHEAEAAMAKAHELIAKYNLDIIIHETRRDFVSVFVGRPAVRHPREDYYLARLLQEYYFVTGLWVPAYVLEKSKMGRVLEISGTVHNIRLASYVHDFVRHFISSQWNRYNKDKGLNRFRMTDFAVGIIEGFCSKLKRHAEAKDRPEHKAALIKIEDPLLMKYIDFKYPHTARFRRKISNQDDRVVKDGMSVGTKLVISKGIAEKGIGKRPLIEIG